MLPWLQWTPPKQQALGGTFCPPPYSTTPLTPAGPAGSLATGMRASAVRPQVTGESSLTLGPTTASLTGSGTWLSVTGQRKITATPTDAAFGGSRKKPTTRRMKKIDDA